MFSLRSKIFSKPKQNDVESLHQDIDTDVHTKPLEELLNIHRVDVTTGLSTARARKLLLEYGPNALTPPKKTSELMKLFKACCSGFSILIWIGTILCFGSYILESTAGEPESQDHLWLGVVLTGLTLVTGLFSYYQEAKSTKIMESFIDLLPQKTVALRDGERRELNVTDLVPGDIVLIETGDRVPADIRILECQGLKVDNASITGESVPLLRSPMISTGNVLESRNMMFFSTNVVEGTGKGLVVACGDQTVMGRVAKLTSRLSSRTTPIAQEMDLFMEYISYWAVFIGVLFFIVSMAMNYGIIKSVVFLIGIIVANVPEGFLATVTVSLTLTAKRMAGKNCMVRNLQAIETLGCTAVICSDKTGTLTQNKMTVRHLWYDGELREAMIADNWRKYSNSFGFMNLARVASLCNRAEWAHTSEPLTPLSERKIIGDASDAALLKCMEVLVKGGAAFFRSQYTKVFEIPFNSTDKFQANIHASNGRYLLSLKGAPERILERCSKISFGPETRELTQDIKLAYTECCDNLAKNGERVLGFADLELPEKMFSKDFRFTVDPPNFPLQNLRLVGLMAMLDPPRPTVPDAVYNCRLAGIKVVMVTGDHPDTAQAIAKAVGIVTEDPQLDSGQSIVVTGSELRDFGEDQLDAVIRDHEEIVFARTSPVQKLQIVESCQRLQMVTAVTGDGVNDSPALKKADIGVSMGISGSDVSRQVADVVLLDDNFASIVTGIEEGRRLFDNLKSSIAYTLTSNIPQITPYIAFTTFGIPLPLGLLCILCIDLGTDIWPAIGLIYEEPESDLMLRRPRIPRKEALVNSRLVFMSYGQIGVIQAVAGFFAYFVVMAEHGFYPRTLLGLRAAWDDPAVSDLSDSYGQEWSYEQRKVLEYTCHTAFFVAIVITQLADAIICKTRRNSVFHQGMSNWALNWGLLSEVVMACVVSYAPHMDVILKTYPLRAEWWIPGVPFAVVILVYDELRKWWIRGHPGGWWDRETSY